jgi:DNA-binding response OmpR family regulator
MDVLLFSQYPEESAVLKVILGQAGFIVRSSSGLELAIETWPEKPADMVLIAQSEINQAVLTQISQMRMYTVIPVCVITDPIPENLQVDLLESGTDLVITRPYGVRFLMAQIKALMRRSASVPYHSLPTLSQADLTLDPSTRTVTVGDGDPKRLTQLEFRLLYTLMTNVGQILPAENIVELVWGYTGEGNRVLVRGLVQRLRSKVEPDPKTPRFIMTEPGVGYYFNRY